MTHEDVIYARVCPYCGRKPELINSSEIYGRDLGNMYICRPCEAWVGVHKNSKRNAPKGRLADSNLRFFKREAHKYFDRVSAGFDSRNEAYQWLSTQMDIPIKYTHIGMFNEDQCKEVIKICKNYDPRP